MSNSKDTTKRKVSKTGVLSYKGCKYYIKEKELKGQTVEVVRESEHQNLIVKLGKTTAVARQFEMVGFSSLLKTPEGVVRIIDPQGFFQYKGVRYFVQSPQFYSRTVIVEEIGNNQIQVKLKSVPSCKHLAEPAGEFE